MTELLMRAFVRETEDAGKRRAECGRLAGLVGIACNVLLFLAKIVVGTVSGSVSITADAVNNLSDASSSVMTLIGFHLSQKPADDEHPFGHARFEYLSGLAVAATILLIGFQLAMTSFEKILRPSRVEFSAALFIVLAASICVKLWLAAFYRGIGEKIGSMSLKAASADSRNDVISTAAVLLAAAISGFSGWELDGWIGFGVALFILYSGFDIARETIKPLLGAPADEELVHMVAEETLGFDERILGIHDLMVHDYGPGQCFATVHAELDRNVDPLEAHDLLDDIERMFGQKHNIHMVIHYDPVVTDDAELNKMKAVVLDKLALIDTRLTIHDFRMVRGSSHTNLIFDLVVPRELEGREKDIKRSLDELVSKEDEKYYTVITFDTKSFNNM